jgi:hypothetical protein
MISLYINDYHVSFIMRIYVRLKLSIPKGSTIRKIFLLTLTHRNCVVIITIKLILIP